MYFSMELLNSGHVVVMYPKGCWLEIFIHHECLVLKKRFVSYPLVTSRLYAIYYVYKCA